MLEYLRSIAPPSHILEEDPKPQYHTSGSAMDKLCCSICTYFLNQPLQISCGAVVCLDCCCKWIRYSSSLSCPCCHNHSLGRSTLNSPSPLIISLLDDLLIKCKTDCMKIIHAFHYRAHLSSNCKEHFHQVLDSASSVTIEDVLAKPITSPTTPAESKATGHLVRRIMEQNSGCSRNKAVVKVPTRGQVTLYF